MTIPLDTAKVRLQIQAKSSHPHYKGLFNTCVSIAKEEGPLALYKGVAPGIQRQIINGGLRIGLYDSIKRFVIETTGREDGIPVKVAAGLTSGAIGITVANPTDLVKVRFQAAGPGVPLRYPSSIAAYSMIVREEGLAALWTGLGPNIARNAM